MNVALLTSGHLLPQELVEELLQLSPAGLLAEPYGPLLLLLKVPARPVPEFTAALEQSTRHDVLRPAAARPTTSGALGFGVATTEVPTMHRERAPGGDVDHTRLLAELDAATHYVVPLRAQGLPLRIGRSRQNGIVLRDDSVSQSHAEIRIDGDGVAAVDLQSKNGTWVGGTRLVPGAPRWLQPMDSLQFGRVQGFTCAAAVLRSVLRLRLHQLL